MQFLKGLIEVAIWVSFGVSLRVSLRFHFRLMSVRVSLGFSPNSVSTLRGSYAGVEAGA